MRILWWFVASIGSLISPANFAQYAGNVTDNCQTNGQWYLDACGPWGAELLPYAQWKRGGYTAGVAQIDTNLFDAYAASVVDLNERIGAGRDPVFAQYVQAAHQWQSVDPSNMEERALAFIYHSCRNMRHEAEENGLTYDQPEKYQDLEANSVARTSAQFLYDTYALRNRTLTHAHTRAHTTRFPWQVPPLQVRDLHARRPVAAQHRVPVQGVRRGQGAVQKGQDPVPQPMWRLRRRALQARLRHHREQHRAEPLRARRRL